jgi:hypothetical protein
MARLERRVLVLTQGKGYQRDGEDSISVAERDVHAASMSEMKES